MSSDRNGAFLLTNDDGVDAPGLAALRAAVLGLGHPYRVVAPSGPRSGCGHQVTTHATISVDRRDDDTESVGGTPADCVRLALHHLVPEVAWILSGINAGGNLGTDVYHSGTVAAVREGATHGYPGIAISHYIARGKVIDWERATHWTIQVLHCLLPRPLEPGTFWNVNLPHLDPGAPDPEIVEVLVDPSPLPLDFSVDGNHSVYSGNYQQRARRPAHDVECCFEGRIAVSLLRV
ncbi:5'/3'-nucleotidase SurE [Singulisphaera rosea]